MKICLSIFCLTLALTARAAQKATQSYSLDQSECQELKEQTQDKLNTFLTNHSLDPQLLEIQYDWTPGYWSRYELEPKDVQHSVFPQVDFFNPNPPPNNPPYYVDPICKIQVQVESKELILKKYESHKNTGKGRHRVCDQLVKNLETQVDTFFINYSSGGIINRYCQVSYFKITKK